MKRIFIAAALALLSIASQAQPAYEARKAAVVEESRHVLWETKWCMHEASVAGARQGMTGAPLTSFVAQVCSGKMRVFLVQIAGWTDREAIELIAELADREAQAELRRGR